MAIDTELRSRVDVLVAELEGQRRLEAAQRTSDARLQRRILGGLEATCKELHVSVRTLEQRLPAIEAASAAAAASNTRMSRIERRLRALETWQIRLGAVIAAAGGVGGVSAVGLRHLPLHF
jgi:pyruvate dehydrogenase complex dehydrogenase (E1) component